MDEFKQEVDKIDPSKNIEIGQYRLDSKGNAVQKTVREYCCFSYDPH